MHGGVVSAGKAGYSLLNAMLKPSRFEASRSQDRTFDGDFGKLHLIAVVGERYGTGNRGFAGGFGRLGIDRPANDCRGSFFADPRRGSDVTQNDASLADDAA